MDPIEPPALLDGPQLMAWIKRHGGLERVEVRTYGAGWANRLVCKDGAQLTTTADQDAALVEAQNASRGAQA